MNADLKSVIDTGDIEGLSALLKNDPELCKHPNVIFYAVRESSSEVVDMLISYGAKINVSSNELALLEVCYQRGDLSIFKVLLKHKIDLKKIGNAKTSHRNALHGLHHIPARVMGQFYDLIEGKETMVNSGTGNFVNYDRLGYLPIHHACIHDSAVMSSLLQSDGCVMAPTRYSKLLPWEVCILHGSVSVLQTLVQTFSAEEPRPLTKFFAMKKEVLRTLLYDIEATDALKELKYPVSILLALFAATQNLLYKDVLASMLGIFMKHTLKLSSSEAREEFRQQFKLLSPTDKADLVTLLKNKRDDFDKMMGDDHFDFVAAGRGIPVYEMISDEVHFCRHLAPSRTLYDLLLSYAKATDALPMVQEVDCADPSTWAVEGVLALPVSKLEGFRSPSFFMLPCNLFLRSPGTLPPVAVLAALTSVSNSAVIHEFAPSGHNERLALEERVQELENELKTVAQAREAAEKLATSVKKASGEEKLKLQIELEKKLAKLEKLEKEKADLQENLDKLQKAKNEAAKTAKEKLAQLQAERDKEAKARAAEAAATEKRMREMQAREEEIKRRAEIMPLHNFHTTCDYTCPHMFEPEAFALAFADASWDSVARMLGKLVMFAAEQKKKKADVERGMAAMSNTYPETQAHKVGSGFAHLNYRILPEPVDKLSSPAVKAYVNARVSPDVLRASEDYFALHVVDASLGKTPLMMAMGGGAPLRIVEVLVALGADMTATDDLGFTAVRWGIERLFVGARAVCRCMGIRHDEKHMQKDREAYAKTDKSNYFLRFAAMDLDFIHFRRQLEALTRSVSAVKGVSGAIGAQVPSIKFGSALDRALDFNFNTASALHTYLGTTIVKKSFTNRYGESSISPNAGVLDALYKGIVRVPDEELSWADLVPPPVAAPTPVAAPAAKPSKVVAHKAAETIVSDRHVFNLDDWSKKVPLAGMVHPPAMPDVVKKMIGDPSLTPLPIEQLSYDAFVKSRDTEMSGSMYCEEHDELFKARTRDTLRSMCAEHANAFGGVEEFYLLFNTTYLNNYRRWFNFSTHALAYAKACETEIKRLKSEGATVRLPQSAADSMRPACSVCFEYIATQLCTQCHKLVVCSGCRSSLPNDDCVNCGMATEYITVKN